MSALEPFHPVIRTWFETTLGEPTATQASAWPHIMAGEHVLVSAPTGCGKTLTAFLVALDRFLTGALASGATRVVYVSPLKALNNDVQRNLLAPLAALREQLALAGADVPGIRVATRSGDTESAERQRLLRRPPEILITTPESLNLMLTTVRGRLALSQVDTVIMDEVHAIADNRRGVQLVTALERMVELGGEMQRIALSATVRPLADVAAFVGGYVEHDNDARPRPVTVIDSADRKHIHLTVETPDGAGAAAASAAARDQGLNFWAALGERLATRVQQQRSTLVFANSRALAEQLTLHVNNAWAESGQHSDAAGAGPNLLAYAHHGSLAREVRLDVESRLKAGELRAIIATSSLELGIDIGDLDEVVMVQCPGSAASCLQRIGRAGHGVGETSRAAIVPTFAHDYLEAAAVAGAALERDIEAVRLLDAPLDVLCQIIIGMTGTEAWNVAHLLAVLRRAHPYRNLNRDTLQLVLDMLAGRYASTRIRALAPRIALDTSANELIEARKGALLALYSSGGTIPDRGYYKLRHAEHGGVMGELDEEFVWEARVGQVFTLGTRAWQVERITHDDVLARPAQRASAPPFWRADSLHRNAHLSARLADFLERADTLLAARDVNALARQLAEKHAFSDAAATALIDYLQDQREATGIALPHRHHLLVEHIDSAPGGYESPDGSHQLVLHTFWGGQVNRPFAIALEAAWLARWDELPQMHASNDFIAIQCRRPPSAADLLSLVDAATLDEFVHTALADSEYFGVRFREAAGRALLLPKPRFGRRLPLWLSRQKAKELLRTTRRFADFPIVLEAWRSCLADEFELDVLRDNLAAVAAGAVTISEIHSNRPSPFAANVAWSQITEDYMYAGDTPLTADGNPDPGLLAEVMGITGQLQVSAAVVDNFVARRQRLQPGYAPLDALELVEHVRDLVAMPTATWESLATAVARDADAAGIDANAILDNAAPRLARLITDAGSWVVARADADHVQRSWQPDAHLATLGGELLTNARTGARRDERDAAALAAQWLNAYGPLSRTQLADLLPLPATMLTDCIDQWVAAEAAMAGSLVEGSDTNHVCATDSWEILLRMQRSATRNARRQAIDVRPLAALPLFLAEHANLLATGPAAVELALDGLRGHVAAVASIESDLLPARVGDYRGDRLDAQLSAGHYLWLGAGERRVTIAGNDEIDLVLRGKSDALAGKPDDSLINAFVDPHARYDFATLAERAGSTDPAAFSTELWSAVWQGAVTTDDFALLRTGLTNGFELPARLSGEDNLPQRSQLRRRARQRVRGWPGNFRRVHAPPSDDTPLGRFERLRERTRMLLERYGVLCRDLVTREAPAFRWKATFAALRTMELAGEVTAGLFFADLSAPQFASPQALHRLSGQLDGTRLYWLACTDPLSPAGLLDGLPQRRPGNWVVLRGSQVISRIEADGRRLWFDLPPDDADAHAMLWPLETQLYGSARRRDRITVKTINGEPAPGSPYLALLRTRFDVHHDHRQVDLLRSRETLLSPGAANTHTRVSPA